MVLALLCEGRAVGRGTQSQVGQCKERFGQSRGRERLSEKGQADCTEGVSLGMQKGTRRGGVG